MSPDPNDRIAALLERLAQSDPAAVGAAQLARWAEEFDLLLADVEDCVRAWRGLGLALTAPLATDDTAPPAPLLPAGYTMVEELGRGGMGVVYRVRHDALQRDVALKIILPGRSRFEEALARFRREARSLAKLRHQHIVAIHDFGVFEGAMWFTMEWIDGTTLDRELEAGPLPIRRAVRVVQQVAEAVDYAHGQGVIHRDLKPSNILLEPQSGESDGEHAKVVDFGLARLDEDTHGDASTLDLATRTGQLLGTPAYMSPEQIRGEVADEAADVWALGAILFECLTGRRPFEHSELHALIGAIASDPVPTPSAVRPPEKDKRSRRRSEPPRIPTALDAICLQAMHRSPGRRYPTARALADDLDRFASGRPIVARPPAATERAWLWMKRYAGHLMMALVGGLVALAIVFALTGIGRPVAVEEHLRAGHEARNNAEYALAANEFDQVASACEGDAHWSARALSLASQVDRLSELTRLNRASTRKEQIAKTRAWLSESDNLAGFSEDPSYSGMQLWIERARFEVMASLRNHPALDRLLNEVPRATLVEAIAQRIESNETRHSELLPTVRLLLVSLRKPESEPAWRSLSQSRQARCKRAINRVRLWLSRFERDRARTLETNEFALSTRRLVVSRRARIAILAQRGADEPVPLHELLVRLDEGGARQRVWLASNLPSHAAGGSISLRWPHDEPMDSRGIVPGSGALRLEGTAASLADGRLALTATLDAQPGAKRIRRKINVVTEVPDRGAIVAGMLELDGRPTHRPTTTLIVMLGADRSPSRSGNANAATDSWTLAQWRTAVRTALAAARPTRSSSAATRSPYAPLGDLISLGVDNARASAQAFANRVGSVPEFYGLALGLKSAIREQGRPSTAWRMTQHDDVDLVRAALIAPELAARERLALGVLEVPFPAGGPQALRSAVERGAIQLEDRALLARIRAVPPLADPSTWYGLVLPWILATLGFAGCAVLLFFGHQRLLANKPGWIQLSIGVAALVMLITGFDVVAADHGMSSATIYVGAALAGLLARPGSRKRRHSRSLLPPPAHPPWSLFVFGCVFVALHVQWHGQGIPLWARFPVLLIAAVVWSRRAPRNRHRWIPLAAILSAAALAALPPDAFEAWLLTPRTTVTLLVAAAAISMAMASAEQQALHFRATRRRVSSRAGRRPAASV